MSEYRVRISAILVTIVTFCVCIYVRIYLFFMFFSCIFSLFFVLIYFHVCLFMNDVRVCVCVSAPLSTLNKMK